MMANAMLEIKEESPLFIYCDMTAKATDAPEEEINKAIEEMLANGTIAELGDKYSTAE